MPTSRRRCQPWRKISTRMWNSWPWEPRPALNIFLNPWWFQSIPEISFLFNFHVLCNVKKRLSLYSSYFLGFASFVSIYYFYFLLLPGASYWSNPFGSLSSNIFKFFYVCLYLIQVSKNSTCFDWNLLVSKLPWTLDSEASVSLCLSSHDNKLGRKCTTERLNAAGSERKAAEKPQRAISR